MKMKSIFKSYVSILLTLCMIFSMIAVGTTSTSAFIAEYALTKACDKLVELGVRAACAATLEMSELLNEGQQETVESICSILLMDAAETAIAEVHELCEEILNELYVVEQKLTDYTNVIANGEEKDKVAEAKNEYNKRWSSSFYDILDSQNVYMEDAYNAYVKYLVASSLNQNGGYPTDEAEISKLENFAKNWKIEIKPSDVTDAGVAEAKRELFTLYSWMYNSSHDASEESIYGNTKINSAFLDTINVLLGELKGNKDDPTLLSYAATYAYYALPYEHQQYEFVYGVAKSHIMRIMVLEMAYNEYLSCQGEYLCKTNSGKYINWANEKLINSLDNTGNRSYNSLKTDMVDANGNGRLKDVATACGTYLDSTIYINTTRDTGVMKDVETCLGKYIKTEDAVPVNLTINGYESSHDYTTELKNNKQVDDLMHIETSNGKSTAITEQNQITSKTLKFNRVVPGNESGEVYYILDPTQFTSPLELKNIVHDIGRVGPLGGSDRLYGDIHIASCDYLNLKKNMTDGTNTYVCPKNLQSDIENLFNTTAFKAVYEKNTANCLSDLGYVTPSNNLYLISSNYTMSYDGGASTVKSGNMYMQNLNEVADAAMKFNIAQYGFQDDVYENSGNYTLILKNTSNEYLQTVNVKKNDVAGSLQDFKVVYNGNEIDLNSSGKIKPGEKITIKFKLENDNTFASLKCIRNNSKQTETVLIDGMDYLQCFEKDDNGYYNFEYYMPYSNATFVIETKEQPMEKDENGNFIIKTYDDLCSMAKMVNGGKIEYVEGSYVLANDITIHKNEYWDTPIGNPDAPFCGTFDGQGYTISGLTIRQANCGTVGLFGVLKGATVKNTHLKDVDVDFVTESANTMTGALCGEAYLDSVILNCTTSGSVKVKGALDVGGMCGYATDSNIDKCINYCDVESDSKYVGGLIGASNRDLIINNCANLGNVMCDGAIYCGGIVSSYADSIENSYNTGKISGTFTALGTSYYVGPISGDRRFETNCYVLDNNTSYSTKAKVCTLDQFASGEVTFLLNKGVTDSTQAWYQNLDNDEIPNLYPTLTNNDKNTVYTIPSQKGYSNYQHKDKASVLERVDLRTYQRVINSDGTFSEDSKYYYGFGLVNNETKEVTLLVLDTAQRIGVLRFQGRDEKHTAGQMLLLGDYPKLNVTSKELLESGKEEPNIYTDKNGCIFIQIPENGEIPSIKVQYTENPTSEYTPTEYTLKIKVVDSSYFETIGASRTSTLSKDDPNYAVFEAEQAYANALKANPQKPTNSTKDPSKNTTTSNTTIKTGSPIYYVFALLIIFVSLAFILVYKRKRKTN